MSEIIAKTAYLWGVLLLFPLWLLIFTQRKNSQKEMIRAGIGFGIASIVIGQLFSLNDYWHPEYILSSKIPIEDFLYGFIYGGIITEIYEYIFKKEDSKYSFSSKENLILVFVLLMLLVVTGLFLLIKITGWNSIYAQINILLFVGTYTIITRPDLLKPAISSAVIVTIITLIWQVVIIWIYPTAITDNWNLEVLSKILILGVPIEELFFAFGIGFGGANFYELVTESR